MQRKLYSSGVCKDQRANVLMVGNIQLLVLQYVDYKTTFTLKEILPTKLTLRKTF